MLLTLASPLVCQSLLADYFEFIIEQFSFHSPTSLCQALRVVVGMSKQQGQAKRRASDLGKGMVVRNKEPLLSPPHLTIFALDFLIAANFFL